jgi:hypothetical protein
MPSSKGVQQSPEPSSKREGGSPGCRGHFDRHTGHSTGLFSADPGRFQRSFDFHDYPLGTYKGKFAPYWLTIKDRAVVTIEEQYQP